MKLALAHTCKAACAVFNISVRRVDDVISFSALSLFPPGKARVMCMASLLSLLGLS
ncbi:MAG: hypothetical protein U0L58_02885 [Ruminococcus sp.]|nr:hypothetical protein [Ruminococcus sp.]